MANEHVYNAAQWEERPDSGAAFRMAAVGFTENSGAFEVDVESNKGRLVKAATGIVVLDEGATTTDVQALMFEGENVVNVYSPA